MNTQCVRFTWFRGVVFLKTHFFLSVHPTCFSLFMRFDKGKHFRKIQANIPKMLSLIQGSFAKKTGVGTLGGNSWPGGVGEGANRKHFSDKTAYYATVHTTSKNSFKVWERSQNCKKIFYIGWHTRSWTILSCKKNHLASTQVNTIYMLMYIFLTKFYLPNFDLPQLWNFQRPIERHHPKFAYF